MTDASQLNYDFRNPFVTCGATYVPIYRGQKDVSCPYCSSRIDDQTLGIISSLNDLTYHVENRSFVEYSRLLVEAIHVRYDEIKYRRVLYELIVYRDDMTSFKLMLAGSFLQSSLSRSVRRSRFNRTVSFVLKRSVCYEDSGSSLVAHIVDAKAWLSNMRFEV
uniref:Coatomer alpha subunit C-terminal domain-containing protein n=1 Tax=Cucumis sativus TaxID=3659 RepID=A0A0A0LLA0_CUCSA